MMRMIFLMMTEDDDDSYQDSDDGDVDDVLCQCRESW